MGQMLPPLPALLSSVTYGTADFLGGLASRRASTIAVVIVSQFAGLVLVAIALPLLPRASATWVDMIWGGAAGLAGGTGVALLYRGLAIGPMSIVAPVTAVCAVIVPIAVGLAMGEALSMMTGVGIVLAATSIVLVGQSGGEKRSARSRNLMARALRISLAAGVVIGFFLVALERTPATAGLWPLVAARGVSIALFAAIALARPEPHNMSSQSAAVAIGAGFADMVANILYLVAVRQGQLSVIATLASLYPASTILLARVVLGERLVRHQKIGVAGAVAAAAMIVAGATR